MGVIVHIVFRLSEEIIKPTNQRHLINTFTYFNFSRVGLSSTRFLKLQVTWMTQRHWITMEARQSSTPANHWNRSNAPAVNSGVLTVVIISRGMHPKRWIAIQRRRSNAFYKRISTAASRPSIEIPRPRYF